MIEVVHGTVEAVELPEKVRRSPRLLRVLRQPDSGLWAGGCADLGAHGVHALPRADARLLRARAAEVPQVRRQLIARSAGANSHAPADCASSGRAAWCSQRKGRCTARPFATERCTRSRRSAQASGTVPTGYLGWMCRRCSRWPNARTSRPRSRTLSRPRCCRAGWAALGATLWTSPPPRPCAVYSLRSWPQQQQRRSLLRTGGFRQHSCRGQRYTGGVACRAR